MAMKEVKFLATPGEHARIKAQVARERTTFTGLCLNEILRRVERGTPSLDLERKNAVLKKENAELCQRLAARIKAEGNRIGCTSCANVEDCTAEPPVCKGYLEDEK